jgi:hypothetical protein
MFQIRFVECNKVYILYHIQFLNDELLPRKWIKFDLNFIQTSVCI